MCFVALILKLRNMKDVYWWWNVQHHHQTMVHNLSFSMLLTMWIINLDGKNTFHGIGIIATFTPGTRTDSQFRRVRVTSEDIASVGRINIQNFASETNILSVMRYENISDPMIEYPNKNLYFLWKISPVLEVARLLWSGFMQECWKSHPVINRRQHSGIVHIP